MLTVTVPTPDLLERLADLTDRVRLVLWDLSAPLDEATAAQVEMVVIPHYFIRPGGFDVLATLPNLRWVQLPSAGFEHALVSGWSFRYDFGFASALNDSKWECAFGNTPTPCTRYAPDDTVLVATFAVSHAL